MRPTGGKSVQKGAKESPSWQERAEKLKRLATGANELHTERPPEPFPDHPGSAGCDHVLLTRTTTPASARRPTSTRRLSF